MRQLLVFTRNTAPRNASGGFGDAPQVMFSVRGKLEPVPRGKNEVFGPADWTVAYTQYLATIRWRPDVTDDMAINLGSRVFKIRNSPQVERRDRYMEILCEEVAT